MRYVYIATQTKLHVPYTRLSIVEGRREAPSRIEGPINEAQDEGLSMRFRIRALSMRLRMGPINEAQDEGLSMRLRIRALSMRFRMGGLSMRLRMGGISMRLRMRPYQRGSGWGLSMRLRMGSLSMRLRMGAYQ